MADEKELDLNALYRLTYGKIDLGGHGPFWENTAHGIAVGVFAACEAFGEPTCAELLAFFDRAARFDDELVNELSTNIAAWAEGASSDELDESVEWRDTYEAALQSASPETFSTIALELKDVVAEDAAKLA